MTRVQHPGDRNGRIIARLIEETRAQKFVNIAKLSWGNGAVAGAVALRWSTPID